MGSTTYSDQQRGVISYATSAKIAVNLNSIPLSENVLRFNFRGDVSGSSFDSTNGTVNLSVGATGVPLGHSVKDFGAVGDGVTDDTAAIQAAVDVGQSFMTEGVYRVTSTIAIPRGSGITGFEKCFETNTRTRILSEVTSGPVLQLVPTSGGGDQIVGFFQIFNAGVGCDSAIQVDAPNVWLNSVQIASSTPFRAGFVFNSCFGSYLVNLATNGAGVTENCFECNTDFIANFCAQWYTSNVCENAVLVQDCSGSTFEMMVLQVADVGLNLQNVNATSFKGIYSENVALPIVLGERDGAGFARRVRNCSINGCDLGGPDDQHRLFDQRGAHIHLYKAERITIDNVWFGSYFPFSGDLPSVDGIYFENTEAVTVQTLGFPEATDHEPQDMEQLLKRVTTGAANAGITLTNTAPDNSTKLLMKAQGGTPLHYSLQVDVSGNLVTTPFTADYAVIPTVGRNPLTQHADTTAYAIDDFVYVGAATNGNNVYRCVTAGTSGTGTPPTGTGTGILDGGAVWDFHGTLL